MKEGWKYEKLGDITTSINGLWKGKKEPFVKVGVIRNANFNKDITLNFSNIEYLDVEERQYKVRKLLDGDLIVEKSGGSEKQPVGRTVLFRGEGDFSVSNFTSILRINDKCVILPEFLYKYLLFVYYSGATKSMQKATTGIHNILYDKFLEIRIPIPPVPEQERIVSLLDAEFAKIDAIKANAEKQLQDAKALFQSALKDYLTPKKGWSYLPFEKSIVKVKKQKSIKSKDYKEVGQYPVVSQESSLISGYFDDASILYQHDAPVVIFGDHTQNVKYVDFDFIVGADGVHILSPIAEITPKFFYYQLKSIKLRNLGYARHYKLLKLVSVGYPSLSDQHQIAEQLDKISAKIQSLQSNFDTTVTLCNDLKQSILKDIFG